ncbi:hypothetical protein NMY25_001798 [Wohlfahrtiimonas chitiniclastica]|nr:hypothetical protein [Wohlfahrtiimonas chitiniclastica]
MYTATYSQQTKSTTRYSLTLLHEKRWLVPILLDLNIYDKPNLRNIFEGILLEGITLTYPILSILYFSNETC